MTSSIKFTHFSQELLQTFHPRKFLQHSSLYLIETPTIPPTQQNNHSIINYFHANASIVLIVLVCTIISSFGFLCMVKCTIRGSNSESSMNPSAKLPNAGVEKKALNAFPIVTYEAELKLPGLDIACVICLSEFVDGECLRILPKCDHGFHTLCIDTWLSSHSSCPTCRHCLTESDEKTDNCSQATSLPGQRPVSIEVN